MAELSRWLRAFDALREKALAEHSSALLIWQSGESMVEDFFGSNPTEPTLVMSVSKSVTALAVGILLAKTEMAVAEPLAARLIPEWRGTLNAEITLLDILSHSSGLPTARYGSGGDCWKTGTIEEHVLPSTVNTRPSSAYEYNNNAVDFISVITRRALDGKRTFTSFVETELFTPLGINTASWMEDARGDARASGELLICPADLLKVGRLVLNRGRWDGKALIDASWIERVLLAEGRAPSHGLLWWRRATASGYVFFAEGWLGQYLVVDPRANLVAVRLRDPRETGWDDSKFTFDSFVKEVANTCNCM